MSLYDVKMGQNVVGNVELIREGLYYSVNCRCRQIHGMYKLVDRCELGEVSIGICCPTADGMEIVRKLPIKKLGKGEHCFLLIPHNDAKRKFYPLKVDEPCEVIDRLEEARLVTQDGVVGLLMD